MTGEKCFEAWAPAGATWSPWAKPVLFAHLSQLPYERPPDHVSGEPTDLFWVPEAGGCTAVIVEMPGAESVAYGLALARRGYRPVPLFNTTLGPSAVVNSEPIARELVLGAEALLGLHLRHDAPPAFLLDSARMTPAVLPAPGKFDNRWVVFPQDFPSGSHMRASGVNEVLLLHGTSGLQEDSRPRVAPVADVGRPDHGRRSRGRRSDTPAARGATVDVPAGMVSDAGAHRVAA